MKTVTLEEQMQVIFDKLDAPAVIDGKIVESIEMTDKPKRGRPRIHPPGYRASGPPPDTPLRLGEERRAWLKKTYGGYQAGIKQLIDAAMSHDTDR